MNEETPASGTTAIPGDRGRAVVARGFSLQSRVQSVLALAVVGLIGGGFLAWYYTGLAAQPAPVEETRARTAVQGEMTLPPLGPAPPRAVVAQSVESSTLVDEESAVAAELLAGGTAGGPSVPVVAAATSPPPVDPVRQRRLNAPVLIRGAGSYDGETAEESGEDAALDGPGVGRPEAGLARGNAGESALAGLLQPTRSATVAAGRMPDRRFLLAKGAFIDCTLETAIDSSLPGMTTCVTATDVWSTDGSLVLLERGTKLVGETRGEVRHGQERLFVLWSEARTPAGVIVDLASPGTDALGRSGVTGEVDTHFRERFGAAILISLINAGTAALVAAQSDGGSSVVIAPQGASDVAAEALRQTGNVTPTIRVPQGGRMQVLVARDVSFAAVYALTNR